MTPDKEEKGLKDRVEYLKYVEWMKVNYPNLTPVLHPHFVKTFKKTQKP